ncbi:MAG: hypothetical protein KG003_04930 [Bacteroidetes bacterium]|nr:hypothetical protein [Bacteroidota bacterium]
MLLFIMGIEEQQEIWTSGSNPAMNKSNFIAALESMDFDAESLKQVQSLDFTKQMAFTIGEEPQQVDFMTFVNMVKFEEAFDDKVLTEMDDIKLPVVHLNDLILMKMNTGRAQDKADIEELQRIQNSRE